MTNDTDDLLGKDPEFDKFMEDYARLRDELHERIVEFIDENELDERLAAQLLLDLTLNMRMLAYGMSVEHPSVAGLKIDLDRFQGEFDSFIREAKKSGDEFIRSVKSARAAAVAEAEKDEQ